MDACTPSLRPVLLLASLGAALASVEANAAERAYVSQEDAGTIAVVDTLRDIVIGTVVVGKRPRGLRVSPDGKTLYVAVSGSSKAPPGVDEALLPPPDRRADGIAVIDIASLRLVRTIESGSDPESFDLSRDGKRLYVSNEDVGRASIVDIASGRVSASLEVGGEPEGVTTSPDGAFVYVTSEAGHHVAVIDTKKAAVVEKIVVGKRPRAVLFTQDGALAFVSNENDASVTLIDARKHRALGTIRIGTPGARPMGLALSPDDQTLYVANGRGRSVAVIDVAKRIVRRTFEDVAARPWGIAISGDGAKLYVAGGPSNDVAVVDTGTGVVVTRIATGLSPWGAVVKR